MRYAVSDVKRFHRRHGFAVCEELEDCCNNEASEGLKFIGEDLLRRSKNLLALLTMNDARDLRLERAQLVIEEAAELCLAMSNRDEVEVADALADLIYVSVGAAVCWGIPIQQVFDEVHRSNMTKVRKEDELHSKGEGYEPPDIKGVLNRCRQ